MSGPTKKDAEIITLGCRLNAYESDVMRGHARDAELKNTVIINTCAVTNEAVRGSRYAVRKAKKDNPDASIVVTGCAAQIDPKSFADMPEVDRVIGNAEKMLAANFEPETLLGGEPIKVNDIMAVTETAPQLSWGGDLPGQPPLGDLVRRVLKLVPDLPRLRLSSIDPAEIDTALYEALTTETRMTPYLHLSLQAGDNMILKRMKRRHSREDAIELCKKLKTARPDFTFGADIIAGFPTETAEMFENSKSIISEIGIPWLHVFPYSAREGTPAAKITPVDGKTIKARAKTLRETGVAVKAAHLTARIGDTDIALFEDTGLGREGGGSGS